MGIYDVKRRSLVLASAVSYALALGIGLAQAYPAKPIRLIVPFPSGDAADSLAEALPQKLGEKIGQTLGFESRPGAGGTIGAEVASKSVADGYTLLLATSSTYNIGPAINPRIPDNAEINFTSIASVASSPKVVVVANTLPAKSMRELIDYARKNPGKLNDALSGNGTVVHLTTEYFKAQSDTFILHIPYRGTALAACDLVSSKVDLLFDSFGAGMPHVNDGGLRALVVTSAKRSAIAPEMPTVAETVPTFEYVTRFGRYGPKNLPPDRIGKIEVSVNAALADNDGKERFEHLGAELVGGAPKAFTAMVKLDADK